MLIQSENDFNFCFECSFLTLGIEQSTMHQQGLDYERRLHANLINGERVIRGIGRQYIEFLVLNVYNSCQIL